MDVVLTDGLTIRLDADSVEYNPIFNIYIFYKRSQKVGVFDHDNVEWIAPTMKGE